MNKEPSVTLSIPSSCNGSNNIGRDVVQHTMCSKFAFVSLQNFISLDSVLNKCGFPVKILLTVVSVDWTVINTFGKCGFRQAKNSSVSKQALNGWNISSSRRNNLISPSRDITPPLQRKFVISLYEFENSRSSSVSTLAKILRKLSNVITEPHTSMKSNAICLSSCVSYKNHIFNRKSTTIEPTDEQT